MVGKVILNLSCFCHESKLERCTLYIYLKGKMKIEKRQNTSVDADTDVPQRNRSNETRHLLSGCAR